MNKISTLQRFLLPITILIIVSAMLLAEHETWQLVHGVEEGARIHTIALTRLLTVTESVVSSQVKSSMRLLQERSKALGMPSLQGEVNVSDRTVPNLTLGGKPQSNRFELVDDVTALLGGTATLFVKSGEEFVRISTNVERSDGSRAIGTVLDPRGKALAAIRQGKPFYGVVDVLGTHYITGYEPMYDARSEIIGAWYVGYQVDMQVLRQAVEKTRFLQSGFSAVLDYNNHIYFRSDHITQAKAEKLIRERPAGWIFVQEDIPSWGFKVLSAYPVSEARAISQGKVLYQIFLGSLLSTLLIAVIALQLRHLVLKPLGGDPAIALDLVRRISAGDLQEDELHAKPGSLMANMLRMRARLRQMVGTLHQHTERLSLAASVFQHAHDGIYITDADSHIVEVNPAFTTLTGYTREEVLGNSPHMLNSGRHAPEFYEQMQQSLGQTGEWHGEIWNQRKDGEVYAASLDISAVRDRQGQVSHYVGMFSDITQIKEQQQHLEHMAYHDALTQLPNRVLLSDRLLQALASAKRSGKILAVCYLDLDDFKPINDTLGHEAGDQLLVGVADRIRSCLRADDTVARLGGDEFALLLCGLQSTEECQLALDRLLASISAPFMIAGKTVNVSASLGYTLSPFDDAAPDTLLRHADQAMYQAKLKGGRYHQFDAEHDRRTRARHEAQETIEAALPRGEFRLHYQPKVDMRRGQVIGMEALIRWEHPELGLRYPNDFLPVVEETEFVIPLGEWVIGEALRQMSAWQQDGLHLPVSVNISALHLMQPDFSARLATLLAAWPDVPPQGLELEITESAALEDIVSIGKVIEECHRLGVSSALDDFGTGYSSLTYLRRLPVEMLKIDQSFVRDMLHDADDLAIVEAVISLGLAFHRSVIAEGVETPEHGLKLLRMGCRLGQGYGIARPMPPHAVPAWIAAYAPDPSWMEDITL